MASIAKNAVARTAAFLGATSRRSGFQTGCRSFPSKLAAQPWAGSARDTRTAIDRLPEAG